MCSPLRTEASREGEKASPLNTVSVLDEFPGGPLRRESMRGMNFVRWETLGM